MDENRRPGSEPRFKALVIPAACGAVTLRDVLPRGHRLSAARLRSLHQSERIVIADDAGPVGLGAYKRADGEIRVVHELLLDRTLAEEVAIAITEMLLAAVEIVAHEDRITCLTFLLRNSVVMDPFEKRGYTSMVVGRRGLWLQRKLGWLGWCDVRSQRSH